MPWFCLIQHFIKETIREQFHALLGKDKYAHGRQSSNWKQHRAKRFKVHHGYERAKLSSLFGF